MDQTGALHHDPIPIIALLSTYLALQRSRLALIKSSNVFVNMYSWQAATSLHNASANWLPMDAPRTCLNKCRPTMKYEWRKRKLIMPGICCPFIWTTRLPALLYRPQKMRRQDSWSWSWKVIVLSKETENLWHTTWSANQTLSIIQECGTELRKTWKIFLVKPNWDFTWQICKNWMSCFHDLTGVLVQWYIVKQRAARLKNNTSNHLPQPAVPGICVRNNGTRTFKQRA